MKSKLALLFAFLAMFSPAVFAQDAGAETFMSFGKALGAGLAIGLAAMGCGMAQGRASAAALEGISRNPGAAGKIFTPFILGLALIESLAIYALVIAFLLLP